MTDFRFLEQKAAMREVESANQTATVTGAATGVYLLQEDFDRAVEQWPSTPTGRVAYDKQ